MEKTEKLGLPPTGKLGVFRRWLGIYSKEEREVLDYARKLKKTTMQIARGQLTLLSRPKWMRHEDWGEVRKLQNKLERRRRKWLQFTCWPLSACSRFSAGSANGGSAPNGNWPDPSSRWRERKVGFGSSKRSRKRVESVELVPNWAFLSTHKYWTSLAYTEIKTVRSPKNPLYLWFLGVFREPFPHDPYRYINLIKTKKKHESKTL